MFVKRRNLLRAIAPWVLAATLALWTGGVAAQTHTKIGIIDVEKILRESTAGQEVLEELQGFQKEKAGELKSKETELIELGNRYESSRLTLAEDKLASMQKELEDGEIALRRARDDAQREFEALQAEKFQKIELEVMPIINQVGKELGYALIFNMRQAGLVFADEAVDITAAVIERFNSPAAPPPVEN